MPRYYLFEEFCKNTPFSSRTTDAEKWLVYNISGSEFEFNSIHPPHAKHAKVVDSEIEALGYDSEIEVSPRQQPLTNKEMP
jgi:hypothetical protein